MNTSIPLVLSIRNPPAVGRFVTGIIISSVQREVILVSISQGPEVKAIRVLTPFFANFYSPSAIVSVGIAVGIVASLYRTAQYAQYPNPSHSKLFQAPSKRLLECEFGIPFAKLASPKPLFMEVFY